MTLFTIDPNTIINCVVLKVKDLHRQVAFYEKVIGLSVIERTETTAKLGTDGNRTLLELRKTAEKIQPDKGTGLFHFALLLPTREDFATKLFELLSNEIAIDSPDEQATRLSHVEQVLPISKFDRASDHGYCESFYVHDIEGNGIEITVNRSKEEWDKHPSNSKPLNFIELASLANNKSDGKLPTATTIAHVHLRIEKMDETLDFYVNVLGFNEQQLYDDVFYLNTGKDHHQLAGNMWSGENIANPMDIHTGLAYIQMKLPNEEALKQLQDHMKQYIPMQETDNCFIVTDPSNNKIVFSA